MVGHWIAHWWFTITGSRNEAGAMYGLWSGFGGALPDVMIPAALGGWWIHHTCHASPRCLRWGKYEAAGGIFRLCHKHHPDLGGRPDTASITRLHSGGGDL
jgi:hypothetical protein